MKTYKLTAAQIMDIYHAGKDQGNDEYCAYDWGEPTPEDRHLEECLIWGNILTNKEDDYSKKLDVWIDFKKEANI